MAGQFAQLDTAQLSKTPSVPPPPGATIDFDQQNPLETTIITVTSVFMGLTFLFVGIRACTKIQSYSKTSWDDRKSHAFITLDNVCRGSGRFTCALESVWSEPNVMKLGTLAYWIVFLLQVVNEGFGRHFWNVPLIITLSDAFLKLGFVSDWLCNVAYIFVKLTFFILYWNIFKPFRWLKLGIIGGAGMVVIVYTAFIIASLVGAIPPPGRTWLEAWSTSRDHIGERLSVPLAAWALVSDVYILVLPISGVLRLQLSRKKKFGLSMVFMTGIGAIICSSLSLYYRTLLRDEDVTYTVVNIQILVIVELCVGICITCMPAASIYLQHILPPTARQLSKALSYSSKLRKTMPSSQSDDAERNKSYQKRMIRGDGPYRNLTDWELEKGKRLYDLELYPREAVKTNVVAEPFEDYDDDRIHLRTDLEQV